MKMESSGYPSNVKTDHEKDEFVRATLETEGVALNKAQIIHNPGRRAVSKLCLNNLWGELGQRSNMTQAKFIKHPREFFELLSSDEVQIGECLLINEDCIYITYKNSKGYERTSPNTNPIVASYVTCHARLELYSYLEKLQERVLYYD